MFGWKFLVGCWILRSPQGECLFGHRLPGRGRCGGRGLEKREWGTSPRQVIDGPSGGGIMIAAIKKSMRTCVESNHVMRESTIGEWIGENLKGKRNRW